MPYHDAHHSQEHNRRAWDDRARSGQRFTRPATDDMLADPIKAIDRRWLPDGIEGKRILCLGAGGGRQAPVYAAAGAIVTVVDISPKQLELDREIAEQRGLAIRTLATSMDDLSELGNASFEIVINPVSTCYLPNLEKVYREVARVTQVDGIYISQHKQPASLQADTRRSARGYELIEPYYRDGPLPEVKGSLHREPGTLEFLHRWEQIVGWMCRAGFVIEDLSEPNHSDFAAKPGSFGDRSCYVPPYVRIKARRVERSIKGATNTLILPS
ncbi:MAG: class I SAM-dependent methyltransferase [Phycisphaeraceae bacterium]